MDYYSNMNIEGRTVCGAFVLTLCHLNLISRAEVMVFDWVHKSTKMAKRPCRILK